MYIYTPGLLSRINVLDLFCWFTFSFCTKRGLFIWGWAAQCFSLLSFRSHLKNVYSFMVYGWHAFIGFFFTFFSFLPYVYTYFFLLFHTADSFFVAHTTRFGVQLAVLLFVRIISYHPLLWYPGDKKNDIGLRSRKKDTWCWFDFGN